MLRRYACSFLTLKNKRQNSYSSLRHNSTFGTSKFSGHELVIGLEVHAQIRSRAKLFSYSWASKYDEHANTHVDVFDAAFPGTLPKLNYKCVELALRTAFALNSRVQQWSSFDRKHYFYSDLPSGYQITQHYAPLAIGGDMKLPQSGITVNIKQLQLEQDTAKSTHHHRDQYSFIDLNRAGSALMEIVSEPDMKTPEQAAEYLRILQALLRSVGASDGNMEEGSLRCDANVSVNLPGSPRGTRCEIKNLNSIKFATIAITSEALRHISILESGGTVRAETRGFDEHKAETFFLRSKEDTPDYRYMPDPNLPPLVLDATHLESIQRNIPELPEQARLRLLQYGLLPRDVDFLLQLDSGREIGSDGQLSQGFLAYYEDVAKGRDPKVAFNWVSHDLYGMLVAKKETFKENHITSDQLRELIDLVEQGKLTSTSGKLLLKFMMDNNAKDSPEYLAKELSLLAIDAHGLSLSQQLEKLCSEAIETLPAAAHAVRKGNKNVINKLLGYVMKQSKGRIDANVIRSQLERMLLGRR